MIVKKFRDDDGNKYSVEVDLNDAALMNDKFEAEIKVTETNVRGYQASLTGTISLDLDACELIIEVENREIGRIDLREDTDVFDDDSRDFENNSEIDDLVSMINEAEGSNISFEALEGIAKSIPVPLGEPTLCLMKATTITSAAQIARCYIENKRLLGDLSQFDSKDGVIRVTDATRKKRLKRKLILRMIKCLGLNARGMAWKIAKRALKCTLTLGAG